MTRTRVRCLEASARQLPSWADSTCLRLLAWVRYPEAARSMIAWASGCVGHHHPRCRIRASGGQQELQTTAFFSLMAVTQSRAGKGMGPSPLLAQGDRSHIFSLEIGGCTASYETTFTHSTSRLTEQRQCRLPTRSLKTSPRRRSRTLLRYFAS